MDASEMRAMQHREETGYLPDEQYTPDAEDDPFDPEQAEIRAMVIEQYTATNTDRRIQHAHDRIAELEALLAANGIDYLPRTPRSPAQDQLSGALLRARGRGVGRRSVGPWSRDL